MAIEKYLGGQADIVYMIFRKITSMAFLLETPLIYSLTFSFL